jgi:ribosome biogenesis SPOUT family RNA methylase Rps3
MTIMIVNGATGEVIERERTPEEQTQYEVDVAAAQAAEAERVAVDAARAAARESAIAKLSKLGLNVSEINAIVGGV